MTLLGEGLSRFVLGKKSREGREVTHVHGCAWRFLEDLKADYPSMKPEMLSKGWPVPNEDAVQAIDAKSKAAPSMKVYDIDLHGVVVDPLARLRAASWDIGSVVGEKGVEGSFCAIVSISKQGVRLETLAQTVADEIVSESAGEEERAEQKPTTDRIFLVSLEVL